MTAIPKIPVNDFAFGFFTALGAEREEGVSPANVLDQVAEGLFSHDPESAHAFVTRFRAVMGVVGRDEFEEWSRPDVEQTDIFRVHPALLCAAAQVKINRNGKFPLRLLEAEVRRLATEEFADWQWPEAGE